MTSAVTKEMIRDAMTEDIEREFHTLVSRLVDQEDRSQRTRLFSELVKDTGEGTQNLIRLMSQKEREHVDLVNAVLKKLKDFPASERKPHDYTKDELYFFVTCLKFECQISSDHLESLYQAEVSRHFRLEAHHPEFEEQNERECSSHDIREMAVDRLCRSVQSNNGVIDKDGMKRYLPKFPRGDGEAKRRLYQRFVDECGCLVEEQYRELFTMRDGSVPQLKENEQFHVFISHSSGDMELSNDIMVALERRGFKCCHSDRDFVPGTSIVRNIVWGLQRSRCVVTLVTDNFLASEWTHFEVAQTVQLQCENKRVMMIPVLHGVTPDEVPFHIKQVNYVEYERSDWLTKLDSAIKSDIPLTSAIPAGDVAHGLAWSYYFGFLDLVLPELPDRIRQSEFGKEGVPFLEKMIIISPASCVCPDKISNVGADLITFRGHIHFTASRAGNVDRSYKSSVYRVKDPASEDEFYFVGEFATPLHSLHQMEISTVAGLSAEAKGHQRKLFEEKVEEILTHENNRKSHNRAFIVQYKDPKSIAASPDHLPTILVKKIRTELQKQKEVEEYTSQMKGHA